MSNIDGQSASSGILTGVKVLDLTRVLAGPWCTQALADMGATVYKVERPHTGDEMRNIPPYINALDGSAPPTSTCYAALNRGKQSVTIDISHPAGQSLICDMAATCDVFVENYKSGDLKRYGLDYESIKKNNPEIIYCSITGYGPTGPMSSFPGYDPIFQAITGMMSTCGIPDGQPGGGPQRTTIPFTDIMTGMTATSAVLAALLHKNNGGGGQQLDIALLDVAMSALTPYGQTYLSKGKIADRQGNASQLFAPSNRYRCAKDRYILVQIGNDGQWARMCSALNLNSWFKDIRFEINSGRIANSQELDARLSEILALWDVHELAAVLSDAGVPCGAVNSLAEAFDLPQVKHRRIATEMNHPIYGAVPYVRSALNFSKTPLQSGLIPILGQHTDAVLKKELQIGNHRLDELRQAGVI